jgi:ferrochelatase
MRYGSPSIEEKLCKLHDVGIRKIIVIPLYPQYSGSTNGSTFDAVSRALSKQRWVPDLHFVSSYHHHESYIRSVGNSIKEHWNRQGRAEKLIMSFHGVPKKFIDNGDPYLAQCEDSAQRIASYLQLEKEEWMLVFQSRIGAQEWLKPYCDETLMTLPAQGIKSVDIVCPGFSADCLETLEEIQIENGNYFKSAGGEHYHYIPCLNDSAEHAALMADIIHNINI